MVNQAYHNCSGCGDGGSKHCPMFDTELAGTLVKSIQDAVKEVANLNREVGEIKVTVESLKKTLLPNGSPGFIKETETRLQNLELKHASDAGSEQTEERVKKDRQNRILLMLSAASSCIALVGLILHSVIR